MKQLTKANIEQLVDEITAFLEKHHLQSGVCIYFNNKRLLCEGNWDGENLIYKWIQEKNIDPHDYFEYAAYNHILSMSFEGTLYDLINYSGGKLAVEFEQIFSTYLLYTELGNAWNLTAYPLVDDMEIEYTYYNKPEPVIDLYYHSRANYPKELALIMSFWYNRAKEYGDEGSCVIGAGFKFKYDGKTYFMNACSPYQGSISWEYHVPDVKMLLEEIGATDIYFNYGNMD